MIKSHLIEVLRTLNAEEIDKFSLYLQYQSALPILEAEECTRLFSFIKKYFPNFDSPELTKENAYSFLLPSKIFIEGKVDKVMVSIFKHLRNFLLTEKYFSPNNEFNQMLDLAKIYKRRGLNARYLQIINQIETNYIKDQKISFKSILNAYRFDYERHDWLSLYNKHNTDINIPNTIRSLFTFYHIQMTELINRYNIQQWSRKFDTPNFIKDISLSVNIDSDNILSSNPLSFIQQKINKIIVGQTTNVSEIIHISKYLNENIEKFNPDLMKNISTYLRNICIIFIDKGFQGLEIALFKLQKEHIEKGYLFYDGKIPTTTYLSIATTALSVKEFDWAINFIEHYKNKIIGDTTDNLYYNLNLSKYFFEIGEYEKAINNLVFSFQEVSIVVIARRLEIMSYYEIKSDLITYKLDAYKMYLNRISHKAYPSNRKEHQLNFINLFSQIVQSIPGDKARAHKLIKRILAKKLVVDRDWLLEKAREIGNLSDDEYAEAIKNPPTKK